MGQALLRLVAVVLSVHCWKNASVSSVARTVRGMMQPNFCHENEGRQFLTNPPISMGSAADPVEQSCPSGYLLPQECLVLNRRHSDGR